MRQGTLYPKFLLQQILKPKAVQKGRIIFTVDELPIGINIFSCWKGILVLKPKLRLKFINRLKVNEYYMLKKR